MCHWKFLPQHGHLRSSSAGLTGRIQGSPVPPCRTRSCLDPCLADATTETQHWALCWRQAPCLAAAPSWDVSNGLQHIPVLRDPQQRVARGRADSLSISSSSQVVHKERLRPVESPGQLPCLPCLCLPPVPLFQCQSLPPAPGKLENSQGTQKGCEIRRDSLSAGTTRMPTPSNTYSRKLRPQRSQRTLRNVYKLPGPVLANL